MHSNRSYLITQTSNLPVGRGGKSAGAWCWIMAATILGALALPGCVEGDLADSDDGIDNPLAYEQGELRRGFFETPAGVMELEYELIDGVRLFEGDIVLGPEIDPKRIYESAPRNNAAYRWPDGVMPYFIHPGLPDQSRVFDAIVHWNTFTNIKLVPRSSQTDFVTFQPGEGCSSHIGRQGGQQYITLADSCSAGNTIHEIGHALGLWHEQSRADRDDHVIINLDNVEDTKKGNFNQYVDGQDVGLYDIGSIMHYGSYAFSKNNKPTITRLDGTTFSAQRSRLSEGDICGIHKFYGFGNNSDSHCVLQFSWSQGQSAVNMGSSSDRFCFLTKIGGKFKGAGEEVHAYVAQGTWWLGGKSQQQGVHAEARCIPRTSYTGEYSWTQGSASKYMGSDTNQTCFLTRVSGKFEGSGEAVEVFRSYGSWYLGGSSSQQGVAAGARCTNTSDRVGPYTWSQGSSSKKLTAVDSYACGLAQMSGKFEGSGESVYVWKNGTSWYLGGQSQQQGVSAKAYCIR